MKILRQELQNLQPQGGHCRMEVSRDEIFEVRKTLSERDKVIELITCCVRFTHSGPQKLNILIYYWYILKLLLQWEYQKDI